MKSVIQSLLSCLHIKTEGRTHVAQSVVEVSARFEKAFALYNHREDRECFELSVSSPPLNGSGTAQS